MMGGSGVSNNQPHHSTPRQMRQCVYAKVTTSLIIIYDGTEIYMVLIAGTGLPQFAIRCAGVFLWLGGFTLPVSPINNINPAVSLVQISTQFFSHSQVLFLFGWVDASGRIPSDKIKHIFGDSSSRFSRTPYREHAIAGRMQMT